MSRTYRKRYLVDTYRNVESYLSEIDEPDPNWIQWRKDWFAADSRDWSTERWKKHFRREVHHTMRSIDRAVLNKIKKDPDIYDDISMSHKQCVDIWGWD